MYFEESLESSGEMTARFEKSIDTVPLSENSSIAKQWDSESVETSALKVNVQKWNI